MAFPNYLNELTGFSMSSGVALSSLIPGSTGLFTGTNGTGYTGFGQVYGIYWNQPENPSFGLAAHSSGIRTSPGVTGKIFYPRPDALGTGSGIQLKFLITAFSGTVGANSVFLTGNQLTGINSGIVSGHVLPSGIFLHKESYKLLPNFAFPSSDAIKNDTYLYSVSNGGAYPSMLQDNIININLEITWSGASGDALNC